MIGQGPRDVLQCSRSGVNIARGFIGSIRHQWISLQTVLFWTSVSQIYVGISDEVNLKIVGNCHRSTIVNSAESCRCQMQSDLPTRFLRWFYPISQDLHSLCERLITLIEFRNHYKKKKHLCSVIFYG